MFCIKCGHEIPAGAKFCGNCGEPVATHPDQSKVDESSNFQNQVTRQNPPVPCSVSISRKSNFYGSALPISVHVDGEYTGKVDSGKSLNLSISPGNHKIYVSMTGLAPTKSEVVTLNLLPGSRVALTCGVKGLAGAVFLKKS